MSYQLYYSDGTASMGVRVMLEEIGYNGQLKLKNSKVCVVGTGGLGHPIITRLTAMGVGTLRIVDRDVIELSNLHRQTLFDEDDDVELDTIPRSGRWWHVIHGGNDSPDDGDAALRRCWWLRRCMDCLLVLAPPPPTTFIWNWQWR